MGGEGIMTTEQHLQAAEEHGDAAATWFSNSKFGVDFVFDAIVAAHHGLAAQTCERCEGHGVFKDTPKYDGCPDCKSQGWLPRAKS